MPTASDWLTQFLQVVAVVACAPFVTGSIAHAEAIVQMLRGRGSLGGPPAWQGAVHNARLRSRRHDDQPSARARTGLRRFLRARPSWLALVLPAYALAGACGVWLVVRRPVFAARPDPGTQSLMFHHTLLAWDGSPSAQRTVDVVIDLARRYDADVTMASVGYAPAHAETTADRRESVGAARRRLEESFERIRDRAERADVELDQHILESEDPADALLGYVHEHAFGLVVVRHHARGRGGRVLFGGLSDRLTRNPRIPVLVIGNGADDSDHA